MSEVIYTEKLAKVIRVVHTITVYDGDHAPHCTQEAIRDHLGELGSAHNGSFAVELEFDNSCDENFRGSYDDFRKSLVDKDSPNSAGSLYSNITIIYPWDKEVQQ